MKTNIALVGLMVLVVLGVGQRASAQGGYLACVTRAGTEPMAVWAPVGSRCFIVDPYTGYRAWGIVRFFYD